MKINITATSASRAETDLLVIGLIDQPKLPDSILELGNAMTEIIDGLVKRKLVKKEAKFVFIFPTLHKIPAKNIALVGLGKKNKLNANLMREIGGIITSAAAQHHLTHLTISPELLSFPAATLEGLLLANYQFHEFKTKHSPNLIKSIKQIDLTVLENQQKDYQKIVHQVETAVNATKFARDLVNRPPSLMHPQAIAQAASDLAKSGVITTTVFDRTKLAKMGAGAILAVAQGSQFDPYLIHLEYSPANAKKSVALVGKGVTFDSGGLSLKPSASMEDMKSDMAGAATVLGVFKALADLKPSVHVYGVIPVVENMISDKSIRVGDIVSTLSGKTVEIMNTDAEGRLILADALTYAEKLQPDAIIDFATLTGACIVALGDSFAGLMTRNSDMEKSLLQSSILTDEKLWPLPLPEIYIDKMKSSVADLSNIHKGNGGGAIMGGLFLQQFVNKTPFAHIDIAGPSFGKENINSFTPAGASGFGVRLMLDWLDNI
ncbi:MAG: leucyl aminopeptidase [Patescibacteria group bacterium]|jgi:leucyl aminopeptidase